MRARVKKNEVAQLCPNLCDPMDSGLPGSFVHGIFQARVLEWVAISFSRGPPDPGMEPGFPTLQADGFPSEPPGKPTCTSDFMRRTCVYVGGFCTVLCSTWKCEVQSPPS